MTASLGCFTDKRHLGERGGVAAGASVVSIISSTTGPVSSVPKHPGPAEHLASRHPGPGRPLACLLFCRQRGHVTGSFVTSFLHLAQRSLPR